MSASLNASSTASENVIAPGLTAPEERKGSEVETLDAAITVRGLRKSYGELEAVRGIDLQIARGEYIRALGP